MVSPMQQSTGTVPVPDPTELTTQAVDRAIAAYRDVVDTRLAAIDLATRLVADDITRVSDDARTARTLAREDVDRQLTALRELIMERIDHVADVAGEKFAAIGVQFQERDTRVQQAANDSKVSLDAALAAQKEAAAEQNKGNLLAIGKSEQNTKEQMSSMQVQMGSSNKSIEDKIRALESRMDRGEGGQRVAADTRVEQRAVRDEGRANLGLIVLGISILLSVVFFVLSNKG